jgi:hypothetical protein
MPSRSIVALAAAALWALAVLPASALCSLCTGEVRLDSGLADCFVHRAGDALKQLNPDKGFVIMDLRDCGSRDGLPTGATADSPPPVLDTLFSIDAAGLKCLSAAIAGMDDNAFTPSHVFNLGKDCPAQQ